MSKLSARSAAVVTLACIAGMQAHAANRLESSYTADWCKAHGGESEVTMPDGTRADCITDRRAVEVERAHKWEESIGQSLWYAFQTNKRATIVAIVGPGDQRYMYRLNSVIQGYKLPIDVIEIPK